MKKVLLSIFAVALSFLMVTNVYAEDTEKDLINDVSANLSSFAFDPNELYFTVTEDLDLSKGAKLNFTFYSCVIETDEDLLKDPRTNEKCVAATNPEEAFVYYEGESKPFTPDVFIKAGSEIAVFHTGSIEYDLEIVRTDGTGYLYQGKYPYGSAEESIYKKTPIEPVKDETTTTTTTTTTTAVTTTVAPTTKAPENITTVIPEDSKVTNTMFSQIMNDKTIATYEKKENDKVLYSWTFDGSKITSANYDVNLEVSVGSTTNKATIKPLIPSTKDTPLYLQFAHHGALPESTFVTVNVQNTYKDGEILSLYYYNEESKKLEEVATGIEVRNGFVNFALIHCSDYVLLKNNAAPNNAQTSSPNIVLYGTIAGLSLAGIVAIIVANKKKKAE